MPPKSTGTAIHSIIMAPALKGEHVATLTSVSTAKGNIPNEIVLQYPGSFKTDKHLINSNVLGHISPANLYNILPVYLNYVKLLFNVFCFVNIRRATHYEINFSNHTLIVVHI